MGSISRFTNPYPTQPYPTQPHATPSKPIPHYPTLPQTTPPHTVAVMPALFSAAPVAPSQPTLSLGSKVGTLPPCHNPYLFLYLT